MESDSAVGGVLDALTFCTVYQIAVASDGTRPVGTGFGTGL